MNVKLGLALVVGISLVGLLGQACTPSPKAIEAKAEVALPSPRADVVGFVADEAKCNGKLIPYFTQKELGDAPEPEPSLLTNKPTVASVRFDHCMEKDTDPSMSYPVGIEVAMLTNGKAVIIRHSGFEYIAQRWTVVLPDDTHSVTDQAYWLAQVKALSAELKPIMKQDTQMMLGLVERAFMETDPITAFEQEKTLTIGDAGDFNSTVSVVRAWQMSEAKGRAVEFTVNYGPL